uniref:Putative three prime repair exonuclease 1 n=1 Tax=Triatoma infestans TaxID=30076 RepID=A0A023F6M6_TRIIF
MEPIASYVLLDVETTGLQGSHYGRTKITEICLIGVIKNHFKVHKKSEINCSSVLEIPRVVNKLTICFQPEKYLSPMSEKNSGLQNELLEELNPFNSKFCDMLNYFVDILPKPVCLVAHNGIKHDFPLLLAHTKILGKPLPDDVLCADTLPAFKKLRENSDYSWQTHGDITSSSNQPTLSEIIDLTEEEGIGEKMDQNEPKTPSRTTQSHCPPLKQKNSTCNFEPRSPEKASVKRNLNEPTKTSNSLGSVYYHLFKENIPNEHTAEGDTEALLKCIAAFGEKFHIWVQENYIRLNEIQKCW